MFLGGNPLFIEDYYALKKKYNFLILEDACHALGAKYKLNQKIYKVGSCKHSDISIFSLHPLKSITTGEGGAVTTNNKIYKEAFNKFRSHGFIKKNHWTYELNNFGFNYRLSDINCALGISQLKKIKFFLTKRKKIYQFYKKKLSRFSDKLKFIKFQNLLLIKSLKVFI